jgi:hypothetical protein
VRSNPTLSGGQSADKSLLCYRKKAAAEGAVYWYAKKFVVARAARRTYGIAVNTEYESSLPAHQARSHTVFSSLTGRQMVPGWFSQLIAKVSVWRIGGDVLIPFNSAERGGPERCYHTCALSHGVLAETKAFELRGRTNQH